LAFRPTRPGASARDGILPDLSVNPFRRSARNGILPDLSVNPFRRFGTERRPSEAFLVFGGAAGTTSTEPFPPILANAAAACFACRIAVSGRSLSPPFQGGSPNALNMRQVCHSGYWTDEMHVGVLCIVDASGVPWVRRQTRNCPDDVRLALLSIEELPRNGSVRAMSRNSAQCELPHVERSECQIRSSEQLELCPERVF